ncbi:hypothetical protein DV515_00011193 [Chloebia gouldiae]|uniref:Uncharacterized protein n=1 Tax=Chloebia gouldiae TaxID=44316 RepID=A0A3L8S757_CHLGU|nr:hypothetical protein DV515_00011193 [Chloebia gouldiae]
MSDLHAVKGPKLMFTGLDPALSQRGSERLNQEISAPRRITPFVSRAGEASQDQHHQRSLQA